jgi:EAL domain-containing protein (putative c-di-GMP-specific phosphodiesterase class I)
MAMYQAKEDGRQGIQFFKPAMNVKAVERHFIEVGLRRAIEHQEFTLHYQPKIDLKTSAITGAEALIRWSHPTRGFVSPAAFIPIAEACGLIQAIDAWVLRAACEQASAWRKAGLPIIKIAVNVSAREFQDENFADNLFTVLDIAGVEPTHIELELTERVFMHHADTTAAALRTLRKRGVQIAIDDFGTGFSSLSYLRKFPIDTLKIDQSFIREISAGGGDRVLVSTMIQMAQSLNLRVVAEGVETLDQLRFLKAKQCDEAQGYFFSPPVPAQQFASLLESGISWTDCTRGPDVRF